MNDDSEANHTTKYDDDAPTERISVNAVSQETKPAYAGILDSGLAESIRAEHAQTVADEDRLTFVGVIDEEGRIIVPEKLRKSGVLKPGDEILVQGQLLS